MPSDVTQSRGEALAVGPYRVRTLVDAALALDGGSMFGVVPKPLWERSNPADGRNRIELVSRLLYAEGAGRRILVDTGLGDRWDDKSADIFAIRTLDGGVVAALARLGVSAEEITDVVLTHLHFDHAAGTTVRAADGTLGLTFPSAVHHVQRRQWEWAQHPSMKDAASFRSEDFGVLDGSDRLHLVDGDGEILPGVSVVALHGHTDSMQAVRIHSDAQTVFFPSDLVPTSTHLRWPYIMGYDNQPLVTLDEKLRWLPRAAAEGWVIVFQHDPGAVAARLQASERGVEIAESLRF